MTKQSRQSSEAPWQQKCVCVHVYERERETHTHTNTPSPDTTTYIIKDYSCRRSCGLLGQRFPEERRDFPLIQRDWLSLSLRTHQHTHSSTRS